MAYNPWGGRVADTGANFITSISPSGHVNKMKVKQKKEGKENQLILNLKGIKP